MLVVPRRLWCVQNIVSLYTDVLFKVAVSIIINISVLHRTNREDSALEKSGHIHHKTRRGSNGKRGPTRFTIP